MDFRSRVASRTGLTRGWLSKGKGTWDGSRGLPSGFRRAGSRRAKFSHSRSGGTRIAMAGIRISFRHKKTKREKQRKAERRESLMGITIEFICYSEVVLGLFDDVVGGVLNGLLNGIYNELFVSLTTILKSQ